MSMAMINSVRLAFVTWRETAVETVAEEAEVAVVEEGNTFDWLVVGWGGAERVKRAAKLNKVLVNSGVCESTNW